MQTQKSSDLSGRQIGNYELEALLKRRATSDLYEARDIKLDQPALIEILRTTVEEDPDLAGRFQRRMETVAQIKHRYIGSIIEFSVTEDGYPYAVLEYVSGIWMDQALAARNADGAGLPPVRDALAFGRSIAEALSVGHSAGLIHHDYGRPTYSFAIPMGFPSCSTLVYPCRRHHETASWLTLAPTSWIMLRRRNWKVRASAGAATSIRWASSSMSY